MTASHASEKELFSHLARSLRLPFVDLKEYKISPGILRKLPRDVAKRYRCVAMVCNARRVVLVHDRPADGLFLSTNPALLGLSETVGRDSKRVVELALTTTSALDAALARRLSLPD